MKSLSDGVTALVVGGQPAAPRGNTAMLVLYGILLAIVVVQVTGMLFSVRRFRRWRMQPEARPQGKAKRAWHIFFPLGINLLWAILVLVGLPRGFGTSLAVLVTGMPDIGYVLVASAVTALVWGILRTALAYAALRTTPAGSRIGELVKV